MLPPRALPILLEISRPAADAVAAFREMTFAYFSYSSACHLHHARHTVIEPPASFYYALTRSRWLFILSMSYFH